MGWIQSLNCMHSKTDDSNPSNPKPLQNLLVDLLVPMFKDQSALLELIAEETGDERFGPNSTIQEE
jgi:hypothetical protein